MVGCMNGFSKTKIESILQVLHKYQKPLTGSQIAEILTSQGEEISERTVRLYLQKCDEAGYTEPVGKQGRTITAKGIQYLESGNIIQRLGYMSSKIDRMTYAMTFDLAMRRGTVVINLAILGKEVFRSRLSEVHQVFEQGYAMGTLVGLLRPGDQLGSMVIPPDHVGFCTVCSVTLNGVLLKHGIPTRSLFSGLLEIENHRPSRFVELISYDGTTVDPLQLFIKGRMTDYLGTIRTGHGKIGAGFREIPEESYELALDLADKLTQVGLGAFMHIGLPSQDVLNIPVQQGCCGVIVVGGLNPLAIFEETGVPVQQYALAGLMEFHQLFPYYELKNKL